MVLRARLPPWQLSPGGGKLVAKIRKRPAHCNVVAAGVVPQFAAPRAAPLPDAVQDRTQSRAAALAREHGAPAPGARDVTLNGGLFVAVAAVAVRDRFGVTALLPGQSLMPVAW